MSIGSWGVDPGRTGRRRTGQPSFGSASLSVRSDSGGRPKGSDPSLDATV